MGIVITGASGHLGRLVVEELLDSVDPADLILVTRTPDALAEYAQRGASVRHGDFYDPATLATAFAGGKRMLLISTDRVGARLDAQEAAIEAAVAAGVEFIAYTSIVRADPGNPAGAAPDHFATEQKLRSSRVRWAFLRNSVYADFEAPNLAAAEATGQLVTNAGAGRIALVARADCAAAAAAVVAGGEHDNAIYDITGPELLDADARAALFADLLGKPVEVVQIDDEAYAAGAAEAMGAPIEAGRLMASFGQAVREGHLDVLSPAVEQLTGRPAQSLRTVLEAQNASAPA